MKRLLSLSAGLVVAAIMTYSASAQTTVTSVNVVGFQVSDVPADKPLSILAFPFIPIDGDASITNVFAGQLSAGTNPGDSDLISYWDAGAQGYVRYHRSTYIAGEWANAANPFAATADEVFIGNGFWVRNVVTNSGDKVVNMSGEIVTDNVVTQQVVAGLNLMSYPFNAETAVTNTGLHASMVAGTNPGDSDLISVWDVDAQGYVRYHRSTYISGGWSNASNPFAEDVPNLKMGEGFWVNRQMGGAFVWLENKPYSL